MSRIKITDIGLLEGRAGRCRWPSPLDQASSYFQPPVQRESIAAQATSMTCLCTCQLFSKCGTRPHTLLVQWLRKEPDVTLAGMEAMTTKKGPTTFAEADELVRKKKAGRPPSMPAKAAWQTMKEILYRVKQRAESRKRKQEPWLPGFGAMFQVQSLASTYITGSFGTVIKHISLPSASPPAIERWPQGSLMCILGGSPRESRREKKKKNKKNKKGRRRQSRKTEAACVARFAVTTYWPYTKLVPPPAKWRQVLW